MGSKRGESLVGVRVMGMGWLWGMERAVMTARGWVVPSAARLGVALAHEKGSKREARWGLQRG
jgi:hypothetical protein